MAGLLYKEWLLSRKQLTICGGGILFFSIYFFLPLQMEGDERDLGIDFLYTLLCLVIYLLSGAAQQTLFKCDERKKWADFVICTPPSVQGQMCAKYVFAALISLATFLWVTLSLQIYAVIHGYAREISTMIYAFFFVQLLLRSIEFPFLVRFGSRAGNNYRIGIMLVAAAGLMIYLLFGDLSVFGSFDAFMDKFQKLLHGTADNELLLKVSALTPYIIAALYVLSYRLSCSLYRKGVERYDA